MHGITTGLLHHTILRHIIDHGHAPDLRRLAASLGVDPGSVETALYALRDAHGVVLHPNSTKIWVIHPFALSPTNFLVTSSRGKWWGNCAWCSLGVAALLDEDVTITTRVGGYTEQIEIHISDGSDGQVEERDLLVHFPIPMREAWNNVIYTCSTMLVFQTEEQIDKWSRRHDIPKGDVQPIAHAWEFSKVWYGRHLDPDWKKWTVDEAKEIFSRFNLTHPVWDLDASPGRF